MLQVIKTLISAFYPILKVFFPNLKFNPVSKGYATDVFGQIKDAIDSKEIPIKNAGKKVTGKSLDIERINQYLINENHKEYACLYSCYCMAIPVITGVKLVPEQYDDVCKELGAMTEYFFIKDHDRMLVAGGLKGYKTESVAVLAGSPMPLIQRIIESINSGIPVIVSLAGKHYELCKGYTTVGSELLLELVDPGAWNDTHLETSTMRVFKFDKSGGRLYSTKSGVQRVATSFRFIVKA